METNFQSLFEYLDEKFAHIDNEFKEVRSEIGDLHTSVDNIAKMVKGFQEEMIVQRHRIDMIESWARKVSEKVGVPLPF